MTGGDRHSSSDLQVAASAPKVCWSLGPDDHGATKRMTKTCPAMLAAKRGVNWSGRHASSAKKMDSVTRQASCYLGRIEAGRPDRKIVFTAGGRWEASCLSDQIALEPGRATVEGDSSVEIILDKIRN
jgi:hypothetical protein